MNFWKFNTDRLEVFSHVPSVVDRSVCLVIPSSPDFDPGLLLRPFTSSVWICIFFLFITACCFVTISHNSVKWHENMTSNQIVMFSFWFSFVLVNMFYGGALTMFFVAEVSIPFNSVRDVLIKFPEWKLIMEQTQKYLFIDEPALRVSTFIHNLFYSE